MGACFEECGGGAFLFTRSISATFAFGAFLAGETATDAVLALCGMCSSTSPHADDWDY